MEQSGQIFVPVDPDLRARIEQAAEAEHGTVAGQARRWIAAALASPEATRRPVR